MNRSARPHSDFPCLGQDETFAYIAGYTEGGFAYGVTWEEWEQLEQESSTSSELEIEENRRAHRRCKVESCRIYHPFGPITSHQPATHYQAHEFGARELSH